MLDIYFRRPLFWDYLIVTIAITTIELLIFYDKLIIPNKNLVFSMSSDISGISFTSAGFIITLATVLITFKSSTQITKESYDETNTVFEIFFVSDLYYETIKHLKNCIKSLILIAVSGYFIKLLITDCQKEILFLFCCSGIIIVALSLCRCLLIISKILILQKQE